MRNPNASSLRVLGTSVHHIYHTKILFTHNNELQLERLAVPKLNFDGELKVFEVRRVLTVRQKLSNKIGYRIHGWERVRYMYQIEYLY